MAIDHAHDAGQQPLDQTSVRHVEQQATSAFHNQFNQTSLADNRLASGGNLAGAGDSAKSMLPSLSLFDSSLSGSSSSSSQMQGDRATGRQGDGNTGTTGRAGDSNTARSTDVVAGGNDANGGRPHIGDDLKGRIVKAIGANEGDLTNINKNDNGHGISVGIRQWNQKRGELPDLLKSMHDKNPQKFDQTFGPYAKNLQSEKWVRHANMGGNPDLMKRMKNALNDPEFQKVQIDKAREFAQKSIDTAQRYGLKTEQGAALVADITNQMGEGGARRVLNRAGLHPGGSVSNESAALQRVEHFTHRPNSRDRFNQIASSFSNGDLIRKRVLEDPTVTLA